MPIYSGNKELIEIIQYYNLPRLNIERYYRVF